MNNLKPILKMTIGAPGSGKSTVAKQLIQSNNMFVELNRDNFRRALFGFDNYKDYKFSKYNERLVTESIQAAANKIANDNIRKNIIISDTNLNPEYREKWRKWAEDNGYSFEVQILKCELDVLLERNTRRSQPISPNVIVRMHGEMIEQFGSQFGTYHPSTSLPKAVIFDMDGTLACMKGIRGPFEESKCDLDNPRWNVIQLAEMFKSRDYKIIIVSGRKDSCKEQTVSWLKKHKVPYDDIFMRSSNDSRRDSIIKSELFWNHIAESYHVTLAIDDRDQMVNCWRDMGIECWQVQRGAF